MFYERSAVIERVGGMLEAAGCYKMEIEEVGKLLWSGDPEKASSGGAIWNDVVAWGERAHTSGPTWPREQAEYVFGPPHPKGSRVRPSLSRMPATLACTPPSPPDLPRQFF